MRMCVFLLLMLCCAWAQNQTKNTAEKLGYPAETKLLIVHADDLAVANSVDRASFSALDSRAATSASIMVPCPWLTEVAAYAKSHPDGDLGLHLTLTSEWDTYRWGPIAGRSLPSLLDPDGYFFKDSARFASHAKPEETEVEVRAQIERALKAGIRPTHLDSHMGTMFPPAFFPVYVKLAREYGIPFSAPRPLARTTPQLLKDTDILIDAFAIKPVNVKPEDTTTYYVRLLGTLKPGLTELIVHLGYDDAELRAMMAGHPAFGSEWRQRDFDAITSAEFRKALQDNQVKLIGWKEIKAHWNGKD